MTKQLREAGLQGTGSYGANACRFMEALGSIRDHIRVTDADGEELSLESGLTQAMERMILCCRVGKKLIFIGNGGSAAISSHQAVDYWKNGALEAIAFNDASLLTCISNDYGYEQVFAEPIRRFAKPGDLLIAISSSGKSANILKGVVAAREAGCGVLTLSGFSPSNPLRSLGNINFFVPSDSYGIVEITHLTLLHSMLESYMTLKNVS